MVTSSPIFWKTYLWDSSKSEIKYTSSKGTIEILEKNMLYFEIYKKENF
jgi:hypothetical protein